MFEFDPTDVYEANAEAGWFATKLERSDGEVRWADLSHHRVLEIAEILVDTSDEFRFRSTHGRVYLFRRLTLAGYRKRIQPKAGGADWETLDALKSAVREAIGRAG